jgi:hypothetical protein
MFLFNCILVFPSFCLFLYVSAVVTPFTPSPDAAGLIINHTLEFDHPSQPPQL